MQVSGNLVVGESTAALGFIKGRRGLSPRWTYVLLAASMAAVGIPVAGGLTGAWDAAVLAVEGAVVGLILGSAIARALGGPTARKALAQRGQSGDTPLTVRLTPDALIYDLGDLVTTVRWSCVTDLFRTPKAWVFLAQSSALVVPRRVFVAPEAERAFLAEALSRMPEAARARSPEAVRVAGA